MSIAAQFDLGKERLAIPQRGVDLVPTPTNPGGTSTLWIDSADNHLKKGATDLEAGGGGGVTRKMVFLPTDFSLLTDGGPSSTAILALHPSSFYPVLRFPSDASYISWLSFRLPTDYITGTPIEMHLTWVASTTDIGDVKLFVSVPRAHLPGEQLNWRGWDGLYPVVSTNGSTLLPVTTKVLEIMDPEVTADLFLGMEFGRNGPAVVADNYPGDVNMLALVVSYQSSINQEH
jgi:hypothetical protein